MRLDGRLTVWRARATTSDDNASFQDKESSMPGLLPHVDPDGLLEY